MKKCIYDLLTRLVGYDSIGFDLDDTLYQQNDYDKAVYQSYFLEKFGGDRGRSLSDKLIRKKKNLPKGYPHLFDDFAAEEKIDLDVAELLNYYRNPPRLDLRDKFIMEEVVIKLKNCKKFLFICTNGHKTTQINKIVSLGLDQIIDNIYILSPEDGCPLKPSPAIKETIPLVGKTIFLGDQDIDEQFAANCSFDFIRIKIEDYVQR